MPYILPPSGNSVMFDFIVLRALCEQRSDVDALLYDMVSRIAPPLKDQTIIAIVNEAAQAWDKNLIPTPDLHTFLASLPRGLDMLPPSSYTETQAEEWMMSRKSKAELVASVKNLFEAEFWVKHAEDFGGKYWSEIVAAWESLARPGEQTSAMDILFSKVNLLENLRSLKITPDAAQLRLRIASGGGRQDIVKHCSVQVANIATSAPPSVGIDDANEHAADD